MKRKALTLLQIAITGGIFYWLLKDPYKRTEMIDAISRADHVWLLIGIAVYGVVEVVAGYRWKILLEVQGIFLGNLRIFTLLLIGLFFNFLIPGGTGGDVVKLFYLLKEAPGKAAGALLSVLFDRIVGLMALVVMAAAFIWMRWSWITSTPETKGFAITGIAILGGSGAAVVISYLLSTLGLVHKLPKKFPWRDKLADVALAYSQYGKEWRVTLKAFVASIVSHVGHFFIFYCAARALGQTGIQIPSFKDICTIMPLVNSITSLPISIGGLGVREGLFEVFLSELSDIQGSIAMLISTTGFMITAVWGLLGGLLYLLYRPSEHARLGEITVNIAELEHEVAESEIALEEAGVR